MLGDLHAFDPAALAWTPLPPAPGSAPPPSPRQGQGLAAVGGALYVFGGCDDASQSSESAPAGTRTCAFLHAQPAGTAKAPTLQEASCMPLPQPP